MRRAPKPRATCRDCSNFRECPCGAHGWRAAWDEWRDPDEVFAVEDYCDDFSPRPDYDPEDYTTDDPRIDMMREEGYEYDR